MAKMTTVACHTRPVGKKSRQGAKKAGDIPGIIYGRGNPGTRVSLNGHEVNRLFTVHGSGGLFSLQIDDDPAPVLAIVRELQRHPVSRKIVHVDFMRVDTAQKMEAGVPIMVTGEEVLLSKGGFLQGGAREVQVSCLPQDLPESIHLDASLLVPGDQVLAAALLLPQGVDLVSDPDLVILTVIAEHHREEADATPDQEKPQDS